MLTLVDLTWPKPLWNGSLLQVFHLHTAQVVNSMQAILSLNHTLILAIFSQSSDDEPREEKDHFVAQLYKFMDDRGTPLNRNPTIANKDIDLYRLFRVR